MTVTDTCENRWWEEHMVL